MATILNTLLILAVMSIVFVLGRICQILIDTKDEETEEA